MKGLVYGSTIGAAYLSSLLAQRGWDVEWRLSEFRTRLRPARLSFDAFRSVRALGAKAGARLDFLGRCPELESWGAPSGVRHSSKWEIASEPDRWADREELFRALKGIALASGAKLFEGRSLIAPPVETFGETPVFVDAPFEDLEGWALHWERGRTRRIEVSEAWLPQGRIAAGAPCQFAKVEGALVFLEPHPRGGYALSVYAATRYAVERALLSLKDSRGAGPAAWRALFMVNPGARVNSFTLRSGYSGFQAPGAFCFGEALGVANPAMNLHEMETLEQARRLSELWSEGSDAGVFARVEAWTRGEQERLRKNMERGAFTERLLFSDEARKYTLPMTALLPRALRRFLQAPV